MPLPLRALLVEDNAADAELVVRELRRAGFAPEWHRVETEADLISHLRPDLDIILSDYVMPELSGLRALELLKESELDVPFILISGTIGEETAVAAMKQGAADYLLKDRLARLGPLVHHALEQARLRRERKEAEAALRESDARFRQLAENIHEVFWLTNPPMTEMLYVSPAYERIWGRTCAEVYANPRSWLEAIHADDRGRVFHAAETKMAAGEYDEEYRIVRPDGSVRWVRDRGFPVTGADGRIDRVAGVARDVTERKAAEQALQLFRTLVDQSNDTFEVIDPETARFLDVNEKACIELGYSRAEHLSLRLFDVDPTVDESAWPHLAEKIRASGARSGEGLHRRKDGSTFPIEFNAKWVRLDRDYIVTVVRDVTERKRTEKRIREQAAMLNHAREAIIVRDLYTRRITFWNQGAERLYGWSAAEAEGRHIGELIHADPGNPKEVTEQLLKTGEWHGEHRQVTKAGKSLTVDSHATLVLDDDGQPKSAMVINFDITEQKALEARFLRAQRMESIGTLASGVAHDLNNILSPILMTAQMLREELSPEERDEIVSVIEMSAARGVQIVKQVLTFGRGLEGERLPLQVAHSIKEGVKIMQETFPKNVTIESEIAPGLWTMIGDATQIQQILLNLCVNALDAMPAGGKLRLRAANVDVDGSYASLLPEAAPGPHVLIEVSDTGSGIPPEIVERIFDPFFTTKGVGKGTGLGLSTTLGIVKSHGGAIRLSSQPERGTAFQIYLPASPDLSEAPAGTGRARAPRGHDELILVVDDEACIRDAARRVLISGGYRVALATDGADALALYAKSSGAVDAVITDLMMPIMDGIALIRALRAIAPELPVVASSGLGERAQLAELKAMNVGDLLTKPYGADLLLRTIHGALHPPGEVGPVS